jgi:hypothetical protein
MLSRHQYAPGRGADGTSGVAIRETNALFGNPVDVGRGNVLLTVAAQIKVAQVVCHDENYVRFGHGSVKYGRIKYLTGQSS